MNWMMNKFMALSAFFIVGIMSWLLWPTASVPILAYHQVSEENDIYSVTAEQFAEQMEYLSAKGYHAISLEELFAAYEGKATLPSKPIVITFDDGYEDNFLTALPIMEKYNMKATVFVVPSLVNTPDYLSWQQVLAMKERKIEIGSHTMNHIGLGEVSPEQQRQEIFESKMVLEQHIGTAVKFFAYPYGQFTPISQQLLQEAGYKGASSGIPGLNHKGTDAYALKRVNVPHPRYGLGEFRLRLFRAEIYSKLGI